MSAIKTTEPRSTEPFPPYDYWQPLYEKALARQMRKMETLYNKSTSQVWDGKQVLEDMIAKHGGIQLSDEHKRAIRPLLMSLMWGEMAAWIISLQLAETMPTMEAKMAATSQAFDEARHFYVFREYARAAGIPPMEMDPFSLSAVRRAIETEDLIGKMMCMQILIESVALAVFKQLRLAKLDPVLTDVLRYIERDEARHVAFGSLYVPEALRQVPRRRKVGYMVLQMRLLTDVLKGAIDKEAEFATMGFSIEDVLHQGLSIQRKVYTKMVEELGSGLGFIKPEPEIFEHLLSTRILHMLVMQRRMRERASRRALRPVRKLMRRSPANKRFYGEYDRHAA